VLDLYIRPQCGPELGEQDEMAKPPSTAPAIDLDHAYEDIFGPSRV
jgi:hypothetical protein